MIILKFSFFVCFSVAIRLNIAIFEDNFHNKFSQKYLRKRQSKVSKIATNQLQSTEKIPRKGYNYIQLEKLISANYTF